MTIATGKSCWVLSQPKRDAGQKRRGGTFRSMQSICGAAAGLAAGRPVPLQKVPQATSRPRLHALPRNMAARLWKLSSLRRRRSRAAAVSSSSLRSAEQSTRTSTVGETEKWLSSTGQPRRHSEGRTEPSSLQHAWCHRGMGFRRTGGHHHQTTLESLGNLRGSEFFLVVTRVAPQNKKKPNSDFTNAATLGMAVADVGGHGGYVFRAQELLCRPCQGGRGYQCRSAARDLFESKS
jgi:hypothetical protein